VALTGKIPVYLEAVHENNICLNSERNIIHVNVIIETT
jgi:hypothetical protein